MEFYNALETVTELLDTGSGDGALSGLQLLDWSEGDILSADDSFTAERGVSGADWQLPGWGRQGPTPEGSMAHPPCTSPPLSLSTSDAIDEVLLCPGRDCLQSRCSGTYCTPETLSAFHADAQQPCQLMGLLPREGWGTSTESHSDRRMYTSAPSLPLATEVRDPMAKPEPGMRSFSSPAELQAYSEWMSDLRMAPVQPQHMLPRAWSSGCPGTMAQTDAIMLPERAASTGSDESSTLVFGWPEAPVAGSQVFPLLSHADLGLRLPLASSPPALQIMPLTSGLTAELLNDIQEPEEIFELPSLPEFPRASLLIQRPTTGSMDCLAAADEDDVLKLPSLGTIARSSLPLAVAAETSADQTEQAKPSMTASWTSNLPAEEATQPSTKPADAEQLDKDLGMPLVPEQAPSSARPSRRAAKRAIARVGALMEDASDDEAGQSERTRCPRAGRRVPKVDVEPVPEAVLRNRVTQRQYLDRKKSKTAAVHAHVPELEARLAQLQAELAPLVERHQSLSDELPWEQQLDEVQFMASLGDFQSSMPPVSHERMSTFLQRYTKDPLAACTATLGQAKLQQPSTHAAEVAGLPAIKAASTEGAGAAGAADAEELRSLTPEIVAKLRLSKGQKAALAAQGATNATAALMQGESCRSIASSLQSSLTESMESTYAGWRCSLLTHALCGQMAGLAQHGMSVEESSRDLCAEVLSASQATKLAHMADMHPSACAALCEEIRRQKAGTRLPMPLPEVPAVAKGPRATLSQARILTMADLSASEDVLNSSAAESAAKPSAAALPTPVVKREGAADFQCLSQGVTRAKRSKVDRPCIKRGSCSAAPMVTAGALGASRQPKRPATQQAGSCPSLPKEPGPACKMRARKHVTLNSAN